MTETIAYLREFHFASVVLRLALAMLLGGCIGLERERKRRPAGFRTYMLVCLGAALTMLLSMYEYTLITGPWSALAAELGMKNRRFAFRRPGHQRHRLSRRRHDSRHRSSAGQGTDYRRRIVGFSVHRPCGRRGILRMRTDRVCYDLSEHPPVPDRGCIHSGKTRATSICIWSLTRWMMSARSSIS